jgi:hypothetical protein
MVDENRSADGSCAGCALGAQVSRKKDGEQQKEAGRLESAAGAGAAGSGVAGPDVAGAGAAEPAPCMYR